MKNNRVLAVSLLFTVGTIIAGSSRTIAAPEPEEALQLVQDVWTLVNTQYVDSTFNKKDWQAIGAQYLVKTKYREKAQAYKAVRKMLKELNDPYTQFLDPTEYSQRQASLANSITGVGMTTEDPLGKPSIVISVVEGSPAEEAGVQPEDLIVAVDGKKVKSMAEGKVTQAIRGPIGTTVVLTIQRQGKTIKIPIVRRQINFPTVRSIYKEQENVGYIRLSQFGDNAAREMSAAIQSLETKNPRGYILDLRGNPGGRVDIAAAIASQWMGNTVLTVIRDRKGGCEINFQSLAPTQCRLMTGGKALTDKPLVVLVNGSSASASEMLAGSLQDNYRAIVVGEKTFGKGVVQSIYALGHGTALTLTTDTYLTPKGRSIHKLGIQPDEKLALKPAEAKSLFRTQRKLATAEDRQYMKAISWLDGN
jgi:carboxyl-terminal processing protease